MKKILKIRRILEKIQGIFLGMLLLIGAVDDFNLKGLLLIIIYLIALFLGIYFTEIGIEICDKRIEQINNNRGLEWI